MKAAPTSLSGKHDHKRCIKRALDDAERVCAKRNARLTSLRRRVLELVWASHEPVGAYELLAKLARERGKAAPPTIYRALEFLMELGLVHRISSLNAFLGCNAPARPHLAQFLICGSCRHVSEINSPAVRRAIEKESRQTGFTISAGSLEINGRCKKCEALAVASS